MPDFNFWNDRWVNHEIGFHQQTVHKELVRFHEIFKNYKTVFVPLCGKSLDMLYLRDQGHEVVGIEFSGLAISEFIEENKLTLTKTVLSDLTLYQGAGLKIYQGDLFKLSALDLAGITAVYDRASMVAFDEEERKKYAQFLIHTACDVEIVLAPLLDYGGDYKSGPPFSVSGKELNELYGEHFDIKMLSESKMPARERFLSLGIAFEKEVTWQMIRKKI